MLKQNPYLLLTVFGLFLLVPGIAHLPMVDRDAALFAQASKQMIETQDFWNIRIQNKPRHRKPPGYYWLQTASVQAISPTQLNHPFAYRLPALFSSLLSLWLLYYFASQLFTAQIALLASFIMGASFIFVFETHMAATDSTLLTCLIVIFGSMGLAYTRTEPLPWHQQLGLWLAMAAGILIKGIAPVFAVTTYMGLSFYDRSWRWLSRTGIYWGFPLLVVLTLAWILPLNEATQTNFVWDMLRIDFIPKLQHGMESHGHWPGYYFILFHIVYWPFSLWFWPIIVSGYQNRQHKKIRYAISWILCNWVILECIPTKLPGYILPLLPALSVLLANAILNPPKLPPKISQLHRAYPVVWVSVSMVLVSSLFLVPYGLAAAQKTFELICFLGCVTLVMIAVYFQKQQLQQQALTATIGLALFFNTTLFDSLLPRLESLWLTEKIVRSIQTYPTMPPTPKRPLLSIDYHEPSLLFRLGTWQVDFIRPVELKAKLNHKQPQLVLAPLNQALTLPRASRALSVIEGFHYSKGKYKQYQLWCVYCTKDTHA